LIDALPIFLIPAFVIGFLLCLRKGSIFALGFVALFDFLVFKGVNIGGIHVAIETCAILTLMAVPILNGFGNGGFPTLYKVQFAFVLMVCGLFTSVAISAVYNETLSEATGTLTRIPIWALFAAAPMIYCKKEEDVWILMRCIVIGSIITLLSVIAVGLPTIDDQGGLFRIGYINPLGHGLAMGCLLTTISLINAKDKKWPVIFAGLLLIGLLWTGSRGGVIALLLSVIYIGYTHRNGHYKHVFIIAGGMTAIVITAALFTDIGQHYVRQLIQEGGTSNFYRYEIMKYAGNLFKEHPIFGVGIGGMQNSYQEIGTGFRSLAVKVTANDNDYARLGSELGLFGIVVFGAFFYVLFRAIGRARQKDRGRKPVTLAALGGSLCIFFGSLALFETVIFTPTGWFFLGVCIVCSKRGHR